MRAFVLIGVSLIVLAVSLDANSQVRKKVVPSPAYTTVTGTITLAPNKGKPSGNGQLQITLSKRFQMPERWEEMKTETIPITVGTNDQGPWKYTVKVLLPKPPEKKTAPAPALPVAVFARYVGPWSVSTGGGPVRASSPVFNLRIGEVNVVDLVLKPEFIN